MPLSHTENSVFHLKESNANPDYNVLVKHRDAATKSDTISLINPETLEVVDTQRVLPDPQLRDSEKLKLFFKTSRVVGCCSGVVCLSYYYIPKTQADTVVLWNLTAGTGDSKFVLLQSCVKRVNDHKLVQIRAIGFGFDERNNDYKLVSVQKSFCYEVVNDNHRCYRFGGPLKFEVEVYSLKEDSWRLLPNVETSDLFSVNYEAGMCTGGMFSWLDRSRRAITSFEMSDEVFIITPLPDCMSDVNHGFDFCTNTLVVHLNILPLLVVVMITRTITTIVWVLREFGVKKSWSKLFNNIGPLKLFKKIIVGLWDDSAVLIREIERRSDGDWEYDQESLILLDPCTKKRKEIANVHGRVIIMGTMDSSAYKQSLVPTNRISTTI